MGRLNPWTTVRLRWTWRRISRACSPSPRRRRAGRHHGVSGLSAAERERPRAQRESVLRRAPVPGVFAERPPTGTGLQHVADGRRLHQTLAGVLTRQFHTLFDTKAATIDYFSSRLVVD